MKKNKIRTVTLAAVTAALYAVITLCTEPISYGPVQIRLAEALCVLPFFCPEMIAGVTVGCLVSNLFSPVLWLDVVFGTLATLLGAVGTYLVSKTKLTFLAPLPPVVTNTVIVGLMLTYSYGTWSMVWLNLLTVFVGEAVSVYGIGYPLLLLVKKKKLL